MLTTIPDSHKDLLEGAVYVSLVTVMPDGQPQVTPVWCNFDGTHVKVNSARGRQKDRNIIANPKVSILAVDPNNAFRWIEVRGEVEAMSEEEGVDHINELCQIYTGGEDFYARFPGMQGKETRVVYRIKPIRVNVLG